MAKWLVQFYEEKAIQKCRKTARVAGRAAARAFKKTETRQRCGAVVYIQFMYCLLYTAFVQALQQLVC